MVLTKKYGLDKHGLDKHDLDKHGLDKHGLDKHVMILTNLTWSVLEQCDLNMVF